MPSREASTVRVVSSRMPRGPGQRIRAGNFNCARGCFRRSKEETDSNMHNTVMAAPHAGQNFLIERCEAVTGWSRQGKRGYLVVPGRSSASVTEQSLKIHCVLPVAMVAWICPHGGLMENGVERRAARRFSMMLPLRVRFSAGDQIAEKPGETRDVSFRGLYFTIEANLESGSSIKFVLTLPQQITLAGDVHIRCYARVLRVDSHNGRRGVAAQIERYEFLPSLA